MTRPKVKSTEGMVVTTGDDRYIIQYRPVRLLGRDFYKAAVVRSGIIAGRRQSRFHKLSAPFPTEALAVSWGARQLRRLELQGRPWGQTIKPSTPKDTQVNAETDDQGPDATFEITDDWCRQQLRFAYKLALNSPDTSTQNGALVFDARGVVHVGYGWNDFTHGVEVSDDILERPKKYAFIEHAERNAIFDSFDTSNPAERPRIMVAAWAACTDCSRAIVQSGIHTLVRHERIDTSGRWAESIEWADRILREGGVKIIDIKGPLGGCDPVLFDGVPFVP